MNCPECQQGLQLLLDGQPLPDRPAHDRHLASCSGCRELHVAAQNLETGLRRLAWPVPPAALAARVVSKVLEERRQRLRFRRRLFAASVAAGFLIALALAAYYRPGAVSPVANVAQGPEDQGSQPSEATAPAASLNRSVAEASSALASLTRRTAEETVRDTRLLLPDMPPAGATPTSELLQQTLDSPTQSLREAGQSVSAGFEPVTSSARRAVNLFLHDIPPMGSDK